MLEGLDSAVVVGTRVLVGDGADAVGVSGAAVGKKLGKVGVMVGAGVAVCVGVDAGKSSSEGATRSTTMAMQVNAVKPPITPMMIPSVRLTPPPVR